MKNLIITLLAFVLTIAVVSAEARTGWGGRNPNSDWGKAACIERSPNVQRAIERYCNNKNGGFFVPSVASKKVLKVGNALAKIDGGCNPGQWLPWDICFKQFYSMCVSGNGRGENNRQYGNYRCQKWRISNPK